MPHMRPEAMLLVALALLVTLASAHGPHRRRPRETRTSSSTTSTTTTTSTTKTRTTTSKTTTSITTTSLTTTTVTTTTSTSTTGPHVFGGKATQDAFAGWLAVWRSKYKTGLWTAGVSDPWESMLPKALRGVQTLVVVSEGGVAGGIVTEGMGYGILVEGIMAARGDATALANALSLTKSWLGMVNGPDSEPHPLGGGGNGTGSATKVDTWPYGVSAVEWSTMKLGPSGLPAWKFPIDPADPFGYLGSAADGDQDAILGMIYLAEALNYPRDFVDMVVRAVISFASADLGFPDLYRRLPGGESAFVPKLGSMWGGLLPPAGRFKTAQQPWCYSPGYFAPAHYRSFRDFLAKQWRGSFDAYLPPHLDKTKTSLDELLGALDSAVTTGYNILYYSSCESGVVSNWVGVKSPCKDDDTLNCDGVPWADTPWVGPAAEKGMCSQSGTSWGAFGADASRSAWRIAMDYVLYRKESKEVTIYDRKGYVDPDINFGARKFLNRIVVEYAEKSICDGGEPGDCFRNTSSPYRFAYAFDPKFNATTGTCAQVPNPPESWWAGFMAYPTFAAFVAPYDEIGAAQMSNWMDTFSSICDFSQVDFDKFNPEEWPENAPKGSICLVSYFEASQAVISTMIMAGTLIPLKFEERHEGPEHTAIVKDELTDVSFRLSATHSPSTFGALGLLALAGVVVVFAVTRRRPTSNYFQLQEQRCIGPQAEALRLRQHLDDAVA